MNASAQVPPDRERAVVAQQHDVLRAEIALQARALVVVERDAFVIVIGEVGDDELRGLVQRQQALASRSATAVPSGVCRCMTQPASSRTSCTAEWMVKPAGLTG